MQVLAVENLKCLCELNPFIIFDKNSSTLSNCSSLTPFPKRKTYPLTTTLIKKNPCRKSSLVEGVPDLLHLGGTADDDGWTALDAVVCNQVLYTGTV